MPNNVELLDQLHRVAQGVPDDLLHMQDFVSNAVCGTARCLVGWARVDNWFIENTEIGSVVDPEFGTGTEELANLFDLSYRDAKNLFGMNLQRYWDGHCVSKQEVLDNIDRLRRGEETVPYKVLQEEESGASALDTRPTA